MHNERPKVGKQSEFERSKMLSELQKAFGTGFNCGPEVSFDPESFKRNMHEAPN